MYGRRTKQVGVGEDGPDWFGWMVGGGGRINNIFEIIEFFL